MSEQGLPVTIAVRRADGSTEQVRIGTAERSGDGFSVRLGELTIGAADSGHFQAPPPRRQAAASRPAGGGGGGDAVFPNYGRSKNAPVAGATVDDLEYYGSRCRLTLEDQSKSRWHDKERVLLAAIEAELANQGAGGGGRSSGGSAPRRSHDEGEERAPSRGGPPANEPPPHTDDDIPF